MYHFASLQLECNAKTSHDLHVMVVMSSTMVLEAFYGRLNAKCFPGEYLKEGPQATRSVRLNAVCRPHISLCLLGVHESNSVGEVWRFGKVCCMSASDILSGTCSDVPGSTLQRQMHHFNHRRQ